MVGKTACVRANGVNLGVTWLISQTSPLHRGACQVFRNRGFNHISGGRGAVVKGRAGGGNKVNDFQNKGAGAKTRKLN